MQLLLTARKDDCCNQIKSTPQKSDKQMEIENRISSIQRADSLTQSTNLRLAIESAPETGRVAALCDYDGDENERIRSEEINSKERRIDWPKVSNDHEIRGMSTRFHKKPS